MERKVLKPHEVAEQIRCSRRQIYDLYNEGELEGFKVGRSIKIFADSIDDFVNRHSNRREQQLPDGGQTLNSVEELRPAAVSKDKTPPNRRPASASSSFGFRHLRLGP